MSFSPKSMVQYVVARENTILRIFPDSVSKTWYDGWLGNPLYFARLNGEQQNSLVLGSTPVDWQ
jgi:hypothetical protein